MLKKLIPLGVAIVIALSLVMCQEGHHHEPKTPGGTIVPGDAKPFNGNVNPIDRTKLVPTPCPEPAESDGSRTNEFVDKEALQTAIETSIQGSFDVDLFLTEAIGVLNAKVSRINLDHWDTNVFAFSLETGLDVEAHLTIERGMIDKEGKLLRPYGLRLERSFNNENKYLDGILREDSRLDIQMLFDETGEPRQLFVGVYMPVALGRSKALGADFYRGEYVDSVIYTLRLDNQSEPYCRFAGLRNGQPVQPNDFPGNTLPGKLWPSKDLLKVFSQRLYAFAVQVEKKQ